MPEPSPTPNPGSQAALDAGCLCPVLDNAHGRADLTGGRWWMVVGCPVHTFQEDE